MQFATKMSNQSLYCTTFQFLVCRELISSPSRRKMLRFETLISPWNIINMNTGACLEWHICTYVARCMFCSMSLSALVNFNHVHLFSRYRPSVNGRSENKVFIGLSKHIVCVGALFMFPWQASTSTKCFSLITKCRLAQKKILQVRHSVYC